MEKSQPFNRDYFHDNWCLICDFMGCWIFWQKVMVALTFQKIRAIVLKLHTNILYWSKNFGIGYHRLLYYMFFGRCVKIQPDRKDFQPRLYAKRNLYVAIVGSDIRHAISGSQNYNFNKPPLCIGFTYSEACWCYRNKNYFQLTLSRLMHVVQKYHFRFVTNR